MSTFSTVTTSAMTSHGMVSLTVTGEALDAMMTRYVFGSPQGLEGVCARVRLVIDQQEGMDPMLTEITRHDDLHTLLVVLAHLTGWGVSPMESLPPCAACGRSYGHAAHQGASHDDAHLYEA